MRVLTVGNRPPDPSAGGYEVVWSGVVEALRGRGHEVDVLHPPALPSWWEDGRWRAAGPLRAWREDRRAREVLRGALPGAHVVVWLNLGGLAMSLLGEAERAGTPQVGLVHDGWMLYGPGRDPWHALLRRRLAPRGGLWCFNSAYALRRTVEQVPLARTAVVSPGIDPERFPEAEARPWTGRLAVVGRLAPQKGVEVALGAVARLPGTTLAVHGPDDGGHGAQLRRRAEDLGVADRVTWAGVTPRDRLRDAYAQADCVLFPVTWPEPWGLVPLEAMAVGRPVVATGTGGSAEYLRDGENALLAAPGDEEALAAAVRRLAGDEALRARLVAGGRATAARHTEVRFLAETCELIEAEARAGARPARAGR